MGLTQSRQFEKQLNEACTKADRIGSTQVSRFLGDTFVTSAAAAVGDLEQNGDDDAFAGQVASALKRLVRERTSSKQTSPRKGAVRPALKRTLGFDTQITLQYDVKQCLISWVTSISSFFEDNEGLSFDPQKGTPGQVYRLLCHLERRHVVDRIRRRILLTVLHKLLEKFRRDRVHDEALNSLASAVFQSGLTGTDLGAIRDNLADWTKKGRRYSIIGNHLGGPGSIILLPYDIGDSIWEHELPSKGQVHEAMIKNLQQRGIGSEAKKEWNVPMPQPDGRNILGQPNVHRIVQEIFDTMLNTLVWVVSPAATTQNPSIGGATNHPSPARTYQESRPSPYASPLTGQALSVPGFDIREHDDLGMVARTEPANLPNIAASLPVQQSQDPPREQSQQSSASHLPSLQYIMNSDPPQPFRCNFSSGGHDDPHTISTRGMTTDATVRQGFSHFDQASIRKINLSPGVYGSLSSQRLQYDGQHRIPPNPQEGERTPGSYGSTAETSNLRSATYLAEGIGEEYAPLFPEADSGFAAGIGDEYAPLFPEPVDGFATDMNDYATFFRDSDNGFVTSTGSYSAEGFAQLHNSDRTNGPSLGNWPIVL